MKLISGKTAASVTDTSGSTAHHAFLPVAGGGIAADGNHLVSALLISAFAHGLGLLLGGANHTISVASSAAMENKTARLDVTLRGHRAQSAESTHATTSYAPIEPSPEQVATGVNSGIETTVTASEQDMALPINPLALDPKESYLSASELDSRPRPVSGVVVPFPKGKLPGERGEVILVLYIAASGVVERVEPVGGSDLPLVFIDSAANAFRGALMVPGVKGGRDVPSQMKVLVQFEEASQP